MCCILCVQLCLSGCSTSQKSIAGATVGLPFAFIGDTALLPFQYLGNVSDYLIGRGYEVGHYTRQGWDYVEYVNQPNIAELIYYIPGYALCPFLPLAQFRYYALTSACMKELTGNKPYRRQRTMYY